MKSLLLSCMLAALTAADLDNNEIPPVPPPPDHTELVHMARYLIHNTDWASVATISTQAGIEGFPFSNVKSMVDGPRENGTGVPYLYMSPRDFTARDLRRDRRATLLVSLQETGWCAARRLDAQDPRCTRLMLSGHVRKVAANTSEWEWARAALFQRHPAMADYPPESGACWRACRATPPSPGSRSRASSRWRRSTTARPSCTSRRSTSSSETSSRATTARRCWCRRRCGARARGAGWTPCTRGARGSRCRGRCARWRPATRATRRRAARCWLATHTSPTTPPTTAGSWRAWSRRTCSC